MRTWIENIVVLCSKHTTGKCYTFVAHVLLIMDGQFYVSIIGLEKVFLYNSIYKAE